MPNRLRLAGAKTARDRTPRPPPVKRALPQRPDKVLRLRLRLHPRVLGLPQHKERREHGRHNSARDHAADRRVRVEVKAIHKRITVGAATGCGYLLPRSEYILDGVFAFLRELQRRQGAQ